VHEEAEEAQERRILVPAMIDKVKPPLGFRRMQAARLMKWAGESNHPELKKLQKGIEAILGPSPLKVKKAAQKRAEEKRRLKQEGKKSFERTSKGRLKRSGSIWKRKNSD
jgi:hypothetical protein